MSDTAEKKEIETRPDSHDEDDHITLLGKTSPGVQRMEILAAHVTKTDKAFIMVALFLVAFTYSLDSALRYVYQVCLPELSSALTSRL